MKVLRIRAHQTGRHAQSRTFMPGDAAPRHPDSHETNQAEERVSRVLPAQKGTQKQATNHMALNGSVSDQLAAASASSASLCSIDLILLSVFCLL